MEKQSIDADCTAVQIIHFIGGLFGMDLYGEPLGTAAIDLRSGMIVRPDADFPDGEVLQLEVRTGAEGQARVDAHRLVESLLVRHAEALTITEGGSAHAHYRRIAEHYRLKTGKFVD